MKIIKVADLKAGVSYDKPVYVDDENILVPAGIIIKAADIQRLTKWSIDVVMTEGNIVKEEKSIQEEMLGNESVTNEDNKYLAVYNNAVNNLDNLFTVIKENKKVNLEEIDNIVNNLLKTLKEHPEEMISFTIRNENTNNLLTQGSINCMILSVVIGLTLKLPSHRIVHLAIGALLHDVGMMRISEKILLKKDNLSKAELLNIKTHTLHSYKIITRELKYPEEIGLIALHHHERWDGKGYPRQLAGKQIMLPARIISVTDAFEAMIRKRPYRNSMIGYQAMRQILNDNSRRFDSEVIKIFIKSMGIYPIGSIVILNNGSIGRIKKIHRDAPLRPVIKLGIDSNGQKIKGKEKPLIDLLKEKTLFIAKAVDPNQIKGIDSE